MGKSSDEIIKKFNSAVREYNMLDTSSLLAAFSGGADSSALLSLLTTECERRGIKLYALHVNHMIRGEEADRDEQFCVSFCKRLGVPLFISKENIPALAEKQGKGLEEAARDFRYAEYERICAENGIGRTATAHNADDSLETLIFNLARGAGSRGFCGIPPVRGNVIRPMLYCTKEEIISYCTDNNISYVTDSTNADDNYTRNFIRHEILPKLKEINPAAAQAAVRGCRVIRRDSETLDEQAKALEGLSYKQVLNSPDALLTRYLTAEYKKAFFEINREQPPQALPFDRTEELLLLAKSSERGKSLSLPGNISAKAARNGIVFEPERENTTEVCVPLCIGENNISELGLKIILTEECGTENNQNKKNEENIYKLSIKEALSFDTIKGKVFCRTRRAGDRYRFGGMERSVKKLLSQTGLTVRGRNRLPVICDDLGILWIPGFPVRDGCKTDGGRTLYIHIRGDL